MSRAIVFDIDDTLYPEESYVRSGFRAAATWVEATLGTSASVALTIFERNFEDGDRKTVFNRFLDESGLDAAHLDGLIGAYRTHEPDIQLYPGVVELLSRLRERGFRLGVLSDGYLDVQRKKVSALGVDKLVDAIVLTDEWGAAAWKPSREPFVRIMELLGVGEPRDAVYVGENATKDFLGARGAGMAAIRVLGPPGFNTHLAPPTPDHAADLEIESLDGLEAALDALWPPSDPSA